MQRPCENSFRRLASFLRLPGMGYPILTSPLCLAPMLANTRKPYVILLARRASARACHSFSAELSMLGLGERVQYWGIGPYWAY